MADHLHGVEQVPCSQQLHVQHSSEVFGFHLFDETVFEHPRGVYHAVDLAVLCCNLFYHLLRAFLIGNVASHVRRVNTGTAEIFQGTGYVQSSNDASHLPFTFDSLKLRLRSRNQPFGYLLRCTGFRKQ